jgi:hypothetical protein
LKQIAETQSRSTSTGKCYEGARFVLLTQHGKERVLRPALASAFRASVEVVEDFDTDTLGSFTREIPRFGTQLEAAREKARIGAKLSGSSLSLASEGSFTPGPLGLGSWDLELVLLADLDREIEILGSACRPARHAHAVVESHAALVEFAQQAGFPEYGLTLRPGDENDPRVQKEIHSWSDLDRIHSEVRSLSSGGTVFVEHDLRAHRNPTRMKTIEAATQDLVQRMATACPGCASPGFGLLSREPGRPCAQCGLPTDQPRAEIFGCVVCESREVRDLPLPRFADPGQCPQCNP